ncbi:MAG: DUF87 domain-containing protein, partial [Thermodesulfobacteriota bacterium]
GRKKVLRAGKKEVKGKWPTFGRSAWPTSSSAKMAYFLTGGINRPYISSLRPIFYQLEGLTMSEQEYIAIANFREKLKQYGLSDELDRLLEAIMMSYLTAGRFQKNLSESNALVLRQLEIGWPTLTDKGKNIAREQIANITTTNEGKLGNILEMQPPRIVALFLNSATRDNDIHYLRFNEDPHNDDYFMRGEISFPELITHPKLHQSIIKIGDELMKAGLGVKYTDLPYRNAKRVAVFIHFPQSVAEKISRWLSERGATLSECESQLKLYLMLSMPQIRIPTLADFSSQGIDKYKLETIVRSPLKRGAITPIADTDGPAFLVLNEEDYKRTVLKPVFNHLVELLIKKRDEPPVKSEKSEKIEIRAEYKGKSYTAAYSIKDKSINYEGKTFSPSAAAKYITNTSINGWKFWKYYDEQTGSWRLIDKLRKAAPDKEKVKQEHGKKPYLIEKPTEEEKIESSVINTPKLPVAPPLTPSSVLSPTNDLCVLLGTKDNKEGVYWSPATERSWNFAIIGSSGTGKTQTVKAVIKELSKQSIPYIVFDFRNDFVPMKSATSNFGSVLDLRDISINPLELDGNNSPRDQKYQVSDIIDLVYTIGERQNDYIRKAIKLSYESKGIYEDENSTWLNPAPTFDDVQKNLELLGDEGSRAEMDSIKGIFARLDPIFDYGIFSAETVMPFEDLIKDQAIINLGILPNDNLKAVVCEFLLRKLRYYLYSLPESRKPKLFIVIDEAHRLKYTKDSSAGQLLKEARKYGVGLMLSTQDPVDFADLVYNNIGGIVSLQLTEPKYAENIAKHLGGGVKWQDVKNGLSEKFSAYVKFSSKPEVIKFKVLPHYEMVKS